VIGEKIKKFRQEVGLTQRQLAERTKHTQQSISQYENGQRNIDFKTLNEICDALGVTIKLVKTSGGLKDADD
jgi:transcriptional regulator with XRE-family HTH domain